MVNYLLKNGTIINEGRVFSSNILIKEDRIEKIGGIIENNCGAIEIDASGKLIIPGCIDDQVHFREPGLTHKGTIFSESRAAVAGGITSFMEMPNTVPNALTQELLEEKYAIASKSSIANFSFFMGASNDNLDEVLKTNPTNVCGIKVFMGSSTGNMLVDNEKALEGLFSQVGMLIATHCEDENTIKANLEKAKTLYGEHIPIQEHPIIRSEEACYKSSAFAVSMARKYGSRLHVLHISTEKETHLFDNTIPLEQKKITAEACIHHLWFTEKDYNSKGNFIKWNPAVKKESDRLGIWKALLDNRIDVIATDHAPHTLQEKNQSYFNAPSGGPLVQHGLLAMLEKVKEGEISLEKIVDKMCHSPAILFRIKDRGFIREGYKADLVVISQEKSPIVTKENCLYSCAWSPFEGIQFSHTIEKTFVNGNIVFQDGIIVNDIIGERLTFKA
ncbi:MAG: dihydroorotase [Flavobacteriia bacterium]|nr:dihydroorotase [Flavobacteriia bacterium]